MRRFFDYALWLLLSVFLVASLAGAQEIDPEAKKPEPIKPPENNSVVDSADELEDLFKQLSVESKTAKAKGIAGQIWKKWRDSGLDNVNLLMEWTSVAMERSDHGKALDLLDDVTVLAPNYAEGWNRRALVYYQLGEYGKSIADIETTLALEPRHFGALSGLAVILGRVGKRKEALSTWYKVLELYPANKQAQKAVIDLEEILTDRKT